MRKVFLLLAVLLLSGCTLPGNFSDSKTTEDLAPAQVQTKEITDSQLLAITVGEQIFNVEVAGTKAQREKGLMGRTELASDGGMLFIFEEADIHSFWMKDTLIPLDILWISPELKIVDVFTAQPCQTEVCEVYTPDNVAQYVLEVKAGNFTGNIGDLVDFSE